MLLFGLRRVSVSYLKVISDGLSAMRSMWTCFYYVWFTNIKYLFFFFLSHEGLWIISLSSTLGTHLSHLRWQQFKKRILDIVTCSFTRIDLGKLLQYIIYIQHVKIICESLETWVLKAEHVTLANHTLGPYEISILRFCQPYFTPALLYEAQGIFLFIFNWSCTVKPTSQLDTIHISCSSLFWKGHSLVWVANNMWPISL